MGSWWRSALRRASESTARSGSAGAAVGNLRADAGFTLIELMVVLLIMGILMGIAIPVFMGATDGANDRSTQSNLTNVLTSAEAIYTQYGGVYPKTAEMTTALEGAEPAFSYTKGGKASTSQSVISVLTGSTTTNLRLYVAAWMTRTGECWAARDFDTPSSTGDGVRYAKLTTTAAKCKATKAKSLAAKNWATQWPTPTPGH
jgi:type IV pilus assembly protein PilA